MNDLEVDPRLEARIRATLHAVADTTPIDPLPVTHPSGNDAPRRRLLALAAAVFLMLGAITVVVQMREDSGGFHPPVSSPSVTTGAELPAGFDPDTATPVFSADGSPGAVADEYLKSRFPDWPAPGVTVDAPDVDGHRAKARWSARDDTGTLAEGSLMLRLVGERWAVVAATTAGLDLSGLRYDGQRVQGVVLSSDDNALFADVLDWRGQPVHGAPTPEGQGGDAYRFGTAAGPGDHHLEIDVAHPSAPAVVRIHHVGGTVLSIAEVRFDPQPLPAHRDYDRCVANGQTPAKEPTPDIVQRRCAEALQGTVISSGIAGDRTWELVASDEPSGRWFTLRSRDQIGAFRVQAGERAESPVACCGIGDHIAMVAVLPSDVAAMRATVAGDVYEAATIRDPGAPGTALAVITIPNVTGARTTAAVDVFIDGQWDHIDDENLRILGG